MQRKKYGGEQYGQDYPNATQLQSLSTAYSSTTGANPTDTVALDLWSPN